MEFNVGEFVFVKVAPFKHLMRFGKKGKLAPRFIGPYEILERVGKVAYRLALPASMDRIHDVFHVSSLRKCLGDHSQVVNTEDIKLSEDLSYEEKPIQILDRRIKQLRNRQIPLVKVLWTNQKTEEATWEMEQTMKEKHPGLFL